MARESIVDKIDALLRKGIDSEAEAVYLLVETRKLIEIRGQKETYPALVFFCDWAMHPVMDRLMAKSYLKLFDDFHKAANFDIPGDSNQALEEAFKPLTETTTLARFKTELLEVLRSESIGDKLLDGSAWSQFQRRYAAVIADCPLKIKDSSTKYVSEVTVHLEDGDDAEDFVMHWDITFKENPPYTRISTFSIEVTERPVGVRVARRP